jgi:thiamine-monophosphate kinase
VTGELGSSALGLHLLEEGLKVRDLSTKKPTGFQAAREHAIERHLRPEPRVLAGQEIGASSAATAMIDISDGLSTDLTHITEESGCGAVIRAGSLPIAKSVSKLAEIDGGIDPLSLALHGGEEYELLFTIRPQNREEVIDLFNRLELAVTEIGVITADAGLLLEQDDGSMKPIQAAGFQHRF